MRLEEDTWRVESGCLLWLGAARPGASGNFYGVVRMAGCGVRKNLGIHRAVVMLGADIEPGMEVDHLCFQTLCVDPDHLEVVTQAENVRRSRPKRHSSPDARSRHCSTHNEDFKRYSDSGDYRWRCRSCYGEYQRSRRLLGK